MTIDTKEKLKFPIKIVQTDTEKKRKRFDYDSQMEDPRSVSFC